MRKYLFPLILAVLAAVSCHEPSSRESFVRGKGPYVFGVDMSDTMSVYDFSFYTRTDPPSRRNPLPAYIPLDLQWISPSNTVYGETVFLPLGDSLSRREPYTVKALYRSETVPAEPGRWTLVAFVPDSLDIKCLNGLGLITEKKARTWDTEN